MTMEEYTELNECEMSTINGGGELSSWGEWLTDTIAAGICGYRSIVDGINWSQLHQGGYAGMK